MLHLISATYFNGYVSDIEILWVLLAAIGATFSVYNSRESMKDLHILRERKITNGRWKIAMTGLRGESARFIIQIIYLTIGIFAMTFPEAPTPPHESIKVAVFQFLFQWGFIVSSAILTLKSYWNYELRRDLINHGIKLEPHESENSQATN